MTERWEQLRLVKVKLAETETELEKIKAERDTYWEALDHIWTTCSCQTIRDVMEPFFEEAHAS